MSEDRSNRPDPRFSKTSPKFIREVHSHCEVPAGCGGAILRWRNPGRGWEGLLKVVCLPTVEYFLNGTVLDRNRLPLDDGPNVLALHMSPKSKDGAGLMMHIEFDPAKTCHVVSGGAPGETPDPIVSCPDGTWKHTLAKPGEGWNDRGFDDSSWQKLATRPLPKDLEQPNLEYQAKLLREAGAIWIGPEQSAQELWIRKVIDTPVRDSSP